MLLVVAQCGCVTPPPRGAADPVPAALTACPPLPNCVSTVSTGGIHGADPIPFQGPAEDAQARLRAILATWPRATITVDRPGFMAVEFRSRVFRFVDDAEFQVDGSGSVIRYRSGARLGLSDLGVNAARMRELSVAFGTAAR
jgi:uncharacterized protein (DUF1499 family)